jgi:hypothetical protein
VYVPDEPDSPREYSRTKRDTMNTASPAATTVSGPTAMTQCMMNACVGGSMTSNPTMTRNADNSNSIRVATTPMNDFMNFTCLPFRSTPRGKSSEKNALRNHQGLMGRIAQFATTGLGHDDHVFDAHPTDAGNINTRLNRKDHAGLDFAF